MSFNDPNTTCLGLANIPVTPRVDERGSMWAEYIPLHSLDLPGIIMEVDNDLLDDSTIFLFSTSV